MGWKVIKGLLSRRGSHVISNSNTSCLNQLYLIRGSIVWGMTSTQPCHQEIFWICSTFVCECEQFRKIHTFAKYSGFNRTFIWMFCNTFMNFQRMLRKSLLSTHYDSIKVFVFKILVKMFWLSHHIADFICVTKYTSIWYFSYMNIQTKKTPVWARKQFTMSVHTLFDFIYMHDITDPRMTLTTTIFTHRRGVSLARRTPTIASSSAWIICVLRKHIFSGDRKQRNSC